VDPVRQPAALKRLQPANRPPLAAAQAPMTPLRTTALLQIALLPLSVFVMEPAIDIVARDPLNLLATLVLRRQVAAAALMVVGIPDPLLHPLLRLQAAQLRAKAKVRARAKVRTKVKVAQDHMVLALAAALHPHPHKALLPPAEALRVLAAVATLHLRKALPRRARMEETPALAVAPAPHPYKAPPHLVHPLVSTPRAPAASTAAARTITLPPRYATPYTPLSCLLTLPQKYSSGGGTACGCNLGSSLGSNIYTAAGSQNLFGGSGSWCGTGCGNCYELTNAGSLPYANAGGCIGAGDKITVVITDLCPANGNQQWCSVPDSYGFPAHFDINGGPAGWGESVLPSPDLYSKFLGFKGSGADVVSDNPIVKYIKIDCSASIKSSYGGCQCAKAGSHSRARRGLVGSTFPDKI